MPLLEPGFGTNGYIDYIDHIDVDEYGTAHFIDHNGIEVAQQDIVGRTRYNVDYADPFHIDTQNHIGENPIDAVQLHYTAGTGTGNAADLERITPDTTATNYTYTINAGNVVPARPWLNYNPWTRDYHDFDGEIRIDNTGYVAGRTPDAPGVAERMKNFVFGDKDSEREKQIKINMKLLFKD